MASGSRGSVLGSVERPFAAGTVPLARALRAATDRDLRSAADARFSPGRHAGAVVTLRK